jgi:hypothetical protein
MKGGKLLDEDIDFISLYKWLWHRHNDMAMSRISFKNSIETFIIKNHGLFDDDTDAKIADILIGMKLLECNSNLIMVKRRTHAYKLVYKDLD